MQEKSADCSKNCTFLVESPKDVQRDNVQSTKGKSPDEVLKLEVKAFLEEAPSIGIIHGKKMDLLPKSNMAFIKKSDGTLALLALFKSA